MMAKGGRRSPTTADEFLLIPSNVTQRRSRSVAFVVVMASLSAAVLRHLDTNKNGAMLVTLATNKGSQLSIGDSDQRWLRSKGYETKIENEREDDTSEEEEEEEVLLSLSSPRPKIYTFFQHTSVSGMSQSANQQLLTAWKLAWAQSGWEPVILTMEQARQHDRFASFQNILLDIPYISEYDQLCFYRWLAMSQVGGGWMADMDVLPLHDFVPEGLTLPNDGRLTVYDRCVPSLVSGSAVEYQRIAFIILYHAQLKQSRHLQVGKPRPGGGGGGGGGGIQPQDTWSDMLSLFDTYRKDESVFLRTFDVMKGRLALETPDRPWPWNQTTCLEITKGKRAIHMSHFAARSSRNRFDDRASLVLSFWTMFRAHCQVEVIHFTRGPRDTGSPVWEC